MHQLLVEKDHHTSIMHQVVHASILLGGGDPYIYQCFSAKRSVQKDQHQSHIN